MSPRTAWVIVFVASLLCYTWAASQSWAVAILPAVASFFSFGFLFNRGYGVSGYPPPNPNRRPRDPDEGVLE